MRPERWQKIKQLHQAALELPESQRGAYLKGACAGDDALRQEVESLLAQQSSAEQFLETPAVAAAAKVIGEHQHPSLVGQQLGSYRIESLLGAGGMGEVYEARDKKLGRNVAIKVLPAAFGDDPERLGRFQREARMLASLNHPNIAAIYGLEESGGTKYLVMELVPGETLAGRLKSGPVPVEEALKIALQIAGALEEAHEKNIIHRDLKPANVKVTPEGRVKVLDFGLAKAFVGDSGLDLSNAPTLTAMGTEEGRILGTLAYMSPEQARGKEVDKRTDIWAFGCVLYELLTSKQAFTGETFSDAIAAILEKEPDWQALPAKTPAKIRELLQRCLQKDTQRRVHDIADARIEIEEVLAAPARAELNAPVTGIRVGWRGALLWGVVLLFLAAVTSVAIWNRKSTSPVNSGLVSRIAITLPPDQPLAGLEIGTALALSPDGTRLVYAAHHGGVQQLYLRPLGELEAKPIPGSEGGVEPFFSPDGQWLGFFADGKLKKVPATGGEVSTLCDAGDPRGASWSSRETIVFASPRGAVLQQVSQAGGTPRPVTHFEEGQTSHRWPEFLPGSDAVLFATFQAGGNWNDAQISVQSLGTGERRDLLQRGTNPRYASSGHLVYAQGGNLIAAPFDSKKLAVTGAAVPVVEGILQSTLSGGAQYSFSDTGSLVYVPASVQEAQYKLVWISRTGAEELVAAPARAYRGPRISPDGREVAVAIEGQETEVWLYDLTRETLTRLTFQGSANYDPLWTQDGKRVVFHSVTGVMGLFWQLADGSGGLERLALGGLPYSLSPDGQVLAFRKGDNISLLRLGDHKVTPLRETTFKEGAAQFSPDGRWLAYVSDESGRWEVYMQSYPGPGGKYQISTNGGTEPLWKPDGRELFYRSGDKIMTAEIATKPRFSAGKPKVLFAGQYQPSRGQVPNANYDISPDGKRFLMLKPVEQVEALPTQINLVLNWFEELKQKVPTGKK